MYFIGCHAVHVLSAVIWLFIVFGMAMAGRFSAERYVGVDTCTIYWIFVVALWPISLRFGVSLVKELLECINCFSGFLS